MTNEVKANHKVVSYHPTGQNAFSILRLNYPQTATWKSSMNSWNATLTSSNTSNSSEILDTFSTKKECIPCWRALTSWESLPRILSLPWQPLNIRKIKISFQINLKRIIPSKIRNLIIIRSWKRCNRTIENHRAANINTKIYLRASSGISASIIKTRRKGKGCSKYT